MNTVVTEMKASDAHAGVKMSINNTRWELNTFFLQMTIFGRLKSTVIDFADLYKVRTESQN